MKGGLIMLGLLLAFLVSAFWLGWGRRGNWQAMTGWSKLTGADQAWQCESAAGYAASTNRPMLQWLGHATMQIEWGGLRLVADPVNSLRVKAAPRLFTEPVLSDQAQVDAILLTHAHMDHLDIATLERLTPSRIYLPSGSERFLSDAVRARHEVFPVRMGEPIRCGVLSITPVPARHGGWRYPWQRGLFACGYVIQFQGEALYLAGDTAMGEHFAAIGSEYAPRYAVLPIGAYSPEWFLRSRHLNPEEAIQAATVLGAEFVIPYHFGTYRLSLEPAEAPLYRFARAAREGSVRWWLPVPAHFLDK